MCVYIIIANNGEMYEDYYEWIEAVYINLDKCKKELERLKKKAEKDYRKNSYFEKRQYVMKKYEVRD